MKINELFKKFYGMKPYLFIDEKEWQHIITTYDKDEVVDELAKCLHTYRCPIPEITEKESSPPAYAALPEHKYTATL